MAQKGMGRSPGTPPFRSYGEKEKSGLNGLFDDLFRPRIPVKLFPAPVRLGRHDAYHGV